MNDNNNDFDPWVYLILAGAIFIAVVYITGFTII
tara:strand:- start:86 stop:187 length:102 start_codon:yes stop_codon:yes gene_type:complete